MSRNPHPGSPHTVRSFLPYCHWWIAQTLPKDGRVCFLDWDILVEGDLAGLFDSELNNCPIGSVAESVLGYSTEKSYWAARGRNW
ncbi:MAG: hypothetical protein JO076_01155 [Verrucomicrobia bacterium]|nr:hypothetical protein [Verrucomicrobiota bacterium]